MAPSSRSAQMRRRSSPQSRTIAYEVLEPRKLLAGFTAQVGDGGGDLVINEIMYHPSSDNALEEYVELHNTTGVALDLQQWQLTDAVQFTFPSVTIAPGGFLVVASDLASFQTKYPTVTNVVGGWEGQLSNRSEKITLEDDTGFDVSALTYADEGAWAERVRGPLLLNHEGWQWDPSHDGGGSSLELRQAVLSIEIGQNWGASETLQGTPGVANSIATTNAAPLISDASHFPAIPSSSDAVTVSATIVNEETSGVTVDAFYRVDGTATFNSVTLFDNGNHNDGAAGDGVFAAQLPAQADGAIIEFYIQASDADSNVRTFPSPSLPSGQQLTNLLYQVDDSFDANDPNAGSAFASYRLIMTEAERAELEQIGDVSAEDESNAQMNGTFIAIDGSTIDVRYNVGIRNRGAGSRNATPNNYRVNLPSDQPWRDFDALNINAQFPYLQKLGLQLFQEAGSPSETGQIISLRVNGADLSLPGDPSFGHYIHVTPGNSDLVKQQFPADSNGNLYQARRDGTSTPADLRVLDTLEDYQEHYQKNTNSSENDYSDLIDLILKLNETPDATYLQTIEQVVDVDNWLAYFAINAILATDETALATGDGDDYLLYSGNNDARFKLLPHDFDSILGQGDSIGSATSGIYVAAENPTIERFLLHDEILPQYHAKLQQLLTTTFAKVAFDPLVEGALSDFLPPSEINELVEFMDERRSYISSLIDGELTISSPLPEFNGYPRSTTGFAAVSGSASLSQTQSVLVNGQLATLDQASGVWELGDVGNATVATLVSPGSNWQYLDAGNVPSTSAGSDWRIDDPGWTDSGDAELGYGDGDSSTTIVDFVDTDPDASGTQKNITTYFRKTFDVADIGEITGLTLNLLRDDGAIVFLNGEELLRDNLPSGPITSTTTAEDVVGGGDEDAFFAFTVDHTKLVSGQNVIAVEIHQISDSSSDISFDLELLANVAGTPSSGGVALVPGINRLVAESYSGTAGTGELLDSAFVDLWYDSGTTQSIGGPIETDTTLTVAGSPYVVTSDLIVRAGATLTIEPGVSIMFDNDVGLEVTDTGRIVAEGTESQRILFTNNPATSNGWDGVRIVDTQSDNRFSYADFVNGAGQGEALVVDHGRAVFDNVSWSGFQQQVMNLDHPTLVVSNSSIPGINAGETVALSGLDQGEQLEFIGNVFGKNTSGGDVIDVGHNTLTPQQVIIRGNVFQGGDDDGIDTDGFPVLIENNIFYGFHYNTSRTTTSNAVSTGRSDVDDQIVSSDLTLIGNIFYDNDHHLLLKDFSSAVLMNNTFYDATIAAISLNEPNGSNVAGPGASLISDGNIFSGFPLLFEAREASTYVEINRSIVPAEFHSEGVGNIDADPSFNDPFNQDFTLRPDSPAFGTGPNGTNIGAFQGSPFAAQTGLRISEIHFNPAAPTAAETSAGFIDNDDFEFLELFNSSTTGVINLDGVQLSDGVTFDFGNIELQPGERAVVVEDIDAFMTRYGNSARVIGEWSGALSNGGEEVTLIDGDMNEIVSVNYGDNAPWYNRADGDGYSLVLDDAVNTPVEELGKYYSWRASAELGGTPGATSTDPVGVVINEILAHTDAPQSDSIELYNPTGQAIDIGGWFLSDSVSSPFKFAIPDGTTISAGGYLVFDESDFNPSPATPSVNHFALSSNGDDVLLSRPIFTAGVVAALIEDSVSFGATFNGQSLGRLPNGTGRLARLASTSLGAANGVAEVGPLVISEISYHPNDPSAEALAIDSLLTDNDLEYIEIANPTSAAIDLTNWRLRGEADFDFAAGTALAAGEATIVVSFDPSIATNAGRLAAFRTHYGIGSEIMIVGGLSASLSNNSGRISLQQPDAADLLGEIPHVVVDEVVYDDRAPWADADGSGLVLERDDLSANGNLATSWIAASPTPGILESQFLLGDANQDGIVNFLDISPFISILSNREYLLEADINQDGVVDFFDIAPFIDELTR